MNKCTVIVGLPGSGKSFLMNQIASNEVLLDDVEIKDSQVFEPGDYILTNPYFCLASKENITKKINQHFKVNIIEFILFENDLEVCWFNVQNRKEYKKISYSFMYYLSKEYSKNFNLTGVLPCLH